MWHAVAAKEYALIYWVGGPEGKIPTERSEVRVSWLIAKYFPVRPDLTQSLRIFLYDCHSVSSIYFSISQALIQRFSHNWFDKSAQGVVYCHIDLYIDSADVIVNVQTELIVKMGEQTKKDLLVIAVTAHDPYQDDHLKAQEVVDTAPDVSAQLSVKRKEKFEVLGRNVGWWLYVRRVDNEEKGYIPSTCVVPLKDDLTHEE